MNSQNKAIKIEEIFPFISSVSWNNKPDCGKFRGMINLKLITLYANYLYPCKKFSLYGDMNTTELFEQSLKEVSPAIKAELDLSFSIADKIDSILKDKGITQKQFAKQIGKTEAEVSRWLSGRHNFTIKTIAKISTELGCDLIQVI